MGELLGIKMLPALEKPLNRSQKMVKEIIGCIRMDVFRWIDVHGEAPGRIFVTPELHLALRENMREIVSFDCGTHTEEYLFGVPVSRYHLKDEGTGIVMAYHLAEKERRFTLSKENA